MQSAKQLDTMLSEFLSNAINGGFVDSEKLGKKLVKKAQDDPYAPPLAKLLVTDSTGEMVIAMNRYWRYCKEISDYQKQNNISSVQWESVEWKKEMIRFPNTHMELNFLPQDGAILSRHKNKTVAKYLDFISRHKLDIMLDDYEQDDYVYVGREYVLNAAKEYDYAWLGHGLENRPVYDGSNLNEKVILYYFTEYTLCLTYYPDDSKDSDSMWFKAIVKTDTI